MLNEYCMFCLSNAKTMLHMYRVYSPMLLVLFIYTHQYYGRFGKIVVLEYAQWKRENVCCICSGCVCL